MRLLLLHALPFDGRMWDAESDLLPGRTLAPTMYGLGDTLEEWAAGVLALVGGEPVVVVGCSVGGSVAIEVARAAPEQVMAIVLVSAKAAVRPEPSVRDEAIGLLEREGMEAGWRTYWNPLLGPNTPPATRAAARGLALDQTVPDVVRGVRAIHDRRDSTEFVAGWSGPLVAISGDHDRSPAASTVAHLGEGPQRRFHLVRDCGHYVNLERPVEFRAVVGEVVGDVVGRSI